MPTCPMCRAPHALLGSTRPLTALRRAPARLARALRRIPRRLVAHRPGHDLNHLAQIRSAHRRLSRPRSRRP